MTEAPELPDNFDSQEELNEHLDQLQEHIQFLEEQLEQSEKNKLELREDLQEIKDKASQPDAGSGGFASIMAPLEAMRERIEEFDEEYLDENSDYGLSDDSEGTEALSEALGADITQDPEDFKKELEDN